MARAPQRTSAVLDGGYVVFLVGLHINKVWRPDRWLSAVLAGRAMDQALRAEPAHGMLDSRLVLTGRGPMFIQIWRSREQLERFAHAPGGAHKAAWQRFNATVGRTGEVGIWHELYQVAPGAYQADYVNTPPIGLAHAGAPAHAGTLAQARPPRRGAGQAADGAAIG